VPTPYPGIWGTSEDSEKFYSSELWLLGKLPKSWYQLLSVTAPDSSENFLTILGFIAV
jgi:hypothetical protein